MNPRIPLSSTSRSVAWPARRWAGRAARLSVSLALLTGCTLDSTGAGGASSTSVTTTDAISSTGNFMPTTATGALCGDGKVDPGEQCDGADLANQSCVLQGFSGGPIKCNATCALDVSACVSTCGDGQKQPSEVCDGADLGGHTCLEKQYVEPSGLACNDCALDFTGCHAVCGNNTKEPGELCDDGNTNDGDACPANCLPGSGGTCGSAIPVSIGFGPTTVLAGNLAGGGDHASADAACPTLGSDRVYAITPTSSGFLTAWLPRSSASFDGALWIAAACDEVAPQKPIDCNDTTVPGDASKSKGGELVSIPVTAGTTYDLFVESKQAAGTATFELDLRLSAGTCADPVPLLLVEGTPQSVVGTNVGANALNLPLGCGAGLTGSEVIYEVKNTFDATTHVDAKATFNVVLYARAACSTTGVELDCSNGTANTDTESIDANVPASTPVYVYVDSTSPTESGDYTLTITP